jgi:hypothetical protein
MPSEENAGEYHTIEIGNKFFESVGNSNIREQPLQIKIPFVKELRAGGAPGMLAIIRCRVFQFALLKCKN